MKLRPFSSRPKVISIIPTTEVAIARVFGQNDSSMSLSMRRDLLAYHQAFSSLDTSLVISEHNLGKSRLLGAIDEGDSSNPLIIIGHSEGGDSDRLLKLPSGEQIPTQQIHEKCVRDGKVCIVITCESSDFHLGSVRLDEAMAMTKVAQKILPDILDHPDRLDPRLRSVMETKQLTEYDLLIYVMRSTVVHQRLGTKFSYAAVGTVSGGGVGVYVYTQSRSGEFIPFWVKNHRITEIWSGPPDHADVVSFGITSSQFCVFLAVRKQDSSRLYVFNPLSNNYFWIDANAVGPVQAPERRRAPKPVNQNCAGAVYE